MQRSKHKNIKEGKKNAHERNAWLNYGVCSRQNSRGREKNYIKISQKGEGENPHCKREERRDQHWVCSRNPAGTSTSQRKMNPGKDLEAFRILGKESNNPFPSSSLLHFTHFSMRMTEKAINF